MQHAQSSYYEELLNAGVRIYLYPQPTVLHAKFFTVDDVAGVIGSSNIVSARSHVLSTLAMISQNRADEKRQELLANQQ